MRRSISVCNFSPAGCEAPPCCHLIGRLEPRRWLCHDALHAARSSGVSGRVLALDARTNAVRPPDTCRRGRRSPTRSAIRRPAMCTRQMTPTFVSQRAARAGWSPRSLGTTDESQGARNNSSDVGLLGWGRWGPTIAAFGAEFGPGSPSACESLAGVCAHREPPGGRRG